jgi:hypothetical protein
MDVLHLVFESILIFCRSVFHYLSLPHICFYLACDLPSSVFADNAPNVVHKYGTTWNDGYYVSDTNFTDELRRKPKGTMNILIVLKCIISHRNLLHFFQCKVSLQVLATQVCHLEIGVSLIRGAVINMHESAYFLVEVSEEDISKAVQTISHFCRRVCCGIRLKFGDQ